MLRVLVEEEREIDTEKWKKRQRKLQYPTMTGLR